MVKIYVKRPIMIEAVQWNGKNFDEIKEFCKNAIIAYDGELVIPILNDDGLFVRAKYIATEGDYMIKDICDEFYFCNEELFNKIYKEVD